MNADALTPSKYLRAADFGVVLPKTPTLTISGARVETVPSLKPGAREGDEEKKGIVYFSDEPDGRGWVMNKTNVQCLKALFGPETEGWVGKRVTLESVIVQVGPKKEPGIRVKGSPDIDREVRVEVKLPKRKPQTFTLTPTGTTNDRQPDRRPTNGSANQAPPVNPLTALRSALEPMGLSYDAVERWLVADGANMDALTNGDVRAIVADLAGPRRPEFDAFVAAESGSGEGPGA